MKKYLNWNWVSWVYNWFKREILVTQHTCSETQTQEHSTNLKVRTSKQANNPSIAQIYRRPDVTWQKWNKIQEIWQNHWPSPQSAALWTRSNLALSAPKRTQNWPQNSQTLSTCFQSNSSPTISAKTSQTTLSLTRCTICAIFCRWRPSRCSTRESFTPALTRTGTWRDSRPF